jgi:hypothetical protein
MDMSKQDKNPMFALQHAVEGLTYIQMSRKLASDGKIQELTQITASALEEMFLNRIHELHFPGSSPTEPSAAPIIGR